MSFSLANYVRLIFATLDLVNDVKIFLMQGLEMKDVSLKRGNIEDTIKCNWLLGC